MKEAKDQETKLAQLVFATANPHKVAEVAAKLAELSALQSQPPLPLLGLQDIGCLEELPETTGTIPGNAMQKARYVRDHYRVNVFAEDSGLEINALEGRPGVDTAHYSGSRDHEANMDRVLAELAHVTSPEARAARFVAVFALCLVDGREWLFEGSVEGQIAFAKTGSGGFGYDPIFMPEGHTQTFASLPDTVKLEISHRARAVIQLAEVLRTLRILQ